MKGAEKPNKKHLQKDGYYQNSKGLYAINPKKSKSDIGSQERA